MAKNILLIKTGSTHAAIRERFGDFDRWFVDNLDNCDVSLMNAVTTGDLPRPEDHDGVIITGSPAMVTDREPWSERLAEWLVLAHGRLPILGVCYGHQLLAHALGGSVGWHPQGREIGTVDIQLTAAGETDPLLGSLPGVFSAQVTHAQRVSRLPPESILLAANDFESHHGFRLGQSTWGVQFHPEFNAAIMKAYLREAQPALQREGRDVAELLAQVTDTDANGGLLRRFAGLL